VVEKKLFKSKKVKRILYHQCASATRATKNQASHTGSSLHYRNTITLPTSLPIMTLQRFLSTARLIAVLFDLSETAVLAEAVQAERRVPPRIAMRLPVDRDLGVDEVERPRIARCLGGLERLLPLDHRDPPSGWSGYRCSAWYALWVNDLRSEGGELGHEAG
jgi:hypothetical protein